MLLHPPLQHLGPHAHGFDGFVVAQVGVEEMQRLDAVRRCRRDVLAGAELLQRRQREQHGGGDDRVDRVPRMEEVQREQEDRRPRHVDEGQEAVARRELPHRVEVAQWLGRIELHRMQAALGHAQRHPEDGVEHAWSHALVEQDADPHHGARAERLQAGVDDVQDYRRQGDHDQRGLVAARQDAIVDLHHVERRHQHQHVDEHADGGNA